jgi:hypothetical protein
MSARVHAEVPQFYLPMRAVQDMVGPSVAASPIEVRVVHGPAASLGKVLHLQ